MVSAANSNPFLLDTNILVSFRHANLPNQQVYADLFDQQRRPRLDGVICAQVLIEYWVVATRPLAANGLGLSPQQADHDLERFLKILRILPEPSDIFDRWRALVKANTVRGKTAHDARIVAIMGAYSLADMITLNPGDFSRYKHINCISPEQWLVSHPANP